MKKTFKRFLSSVLAAVMAASVLSVGMVTSASAADGDAFTVYPSDFYSAYTGKNDKAAPTATSVTKEGATISIPSDTNYYNPFKTYRDSVSNDTGIEFTNGELQIGGGRTITITPAADGHISCYWYENGTKNVTVGSNEALNADNNKVTVGTAPCKAGKKFEIYCDSSNICILMIKFEPGEVETYKWSIDYSNSPVESGLVFGDTDETFTVENTLSYMGTDYVLKDEYTNLTGDTEGVTVSGQTVTVKPTADWFTPVETVSVEPTIEGPDNNITKYDFVGAYQSGHEMRLIGGENESKTETTAYGTHLASETSSDAQNYVKLTDAGALLVDESKDATSALVIPFKQTSGKYTITGEVTPTKNKGGKWALVNFGCVYIASNDKSNAVISTVTNSKEETADSAGAVTVGQKIVYSITIDLDNKTVSGKLTNGSNTKEFNNITITEGIDDITFVTNKGEAVSTGKDRPLLIPSVTIESEKVELDTTPAAGAVLETASDTYIIAGVTEDDMDNSNLTIGVGDKPSLDTTETVFESVVINGTKYSAADVGSDYAYIYAIKLVGANKNEQAKNFTVTLN